MSDLPSDLTSDIAEPDRLEVEAWWRSLGDADRGSLLALSASDPIDCVPLPSDVEFEREAELDDYTEYLINHEFSGKGPFFGEPRGQRVVPCIPLLTPAWPPYAEATRYRPWVPRGRLA